MLSIDIANGVAWPQCGEFIFPKEDTDNNLSIEEKQFKRKLPTLFESYDCGIAVDVEKTLKSLEKFKNLTSPSSEKKCSETQTLSPSLEIVSALYCKPSTAKPSQVIICQQLKLHLILLILRR